MCHSQSFYSILSLSRICVEAKTCKYEEYALQPLLCQICDNIHQIHKLKACKTSEYELKPIRIDMCCSQNIVKLVNMRGSKNF